MKDATKPRGRPPISEEQRLIARSIRLNRSQWEKIDAAGLDALRKLISRWKPL